MRNDAGTILLSRLDVERLLTPDACIDAVEDAFRQLAGGEVPAPGILGMHADNGSFHVKAGFLGLDRRYFAAKLNANFPDNAARHGLPTIQGAVMPSMARCSRSWIRFPSLRSEPRRRRQWQRNIWHATNARRR